ncbi:MAG: helix-turn-helix domain-containing protein [Cyanobacteria bacterium CRU_2_1]|nr:helix-turn-helix domain-containing protein [Cyanobacteria bacterium RU_5_0]NJR61691.1 helix-turn-helix domain-containing protein [Cyanobacteria bacterium CRU_2_1]
MKGGSKYQPLQDYLRHRNEAEIPLTFAEIEQIMDEPLPDSARRSKAWWSNRSKGGLQAKAWMEAGYVAEAVDVHAEQVTFCKPPDTYQVERSGGTILWNGELIKALRRHTGWSQAQLAEQVGVYQQTVSDWEVGAHKPQRSISKLLSLVAEQSGFKYGEKE